MKTIIAPKQRKRYYTELRKLMDAYKINQEEIAEVIGKSRSYTAKRFAGHEAWTLADCHRILYYFGQPWERLPYYFPARLGRVAI